MIKKIWFLLLSVGIIYSFITGNDRMGDIILNTSYDTWEMIVSIAPLVVLWSGIMNIASESGLLYKFSKLLTAQNEATLSAMGIEKGTQVPVDTESRTALADIIYPNENKYEVILSKSNEDKLKSFILSYKNADKLNSLGIGVSNTLSRSSGMCFGSMV